MKIRFTISLSDTTVRGYAEQGIDGGAMIIEDLRETMQERLDEINEIGRDAEQDEEDEDDEVVQ